MRKLELLKNADFGDQIAEQEQANLARYFVKTSLWEQILNDDIDLILGDKGTGKSALFVLMQDAEYNKAARVRTVMKSAEKVKGSPAFKNLASDPPQSEKEIALIWKIHFLSLVMQYVDEQRIEVDRAQEIFTFLSSQDIYHKTRFELSDILLGIRSFVKRISDPEVSVTINDRGEVKYGVSINQGRSESIAYTENQVDKYLKIVDSAFERRNFRFWILLDRLDVAFEYSNQLEKNALRALLRVYIDFASYYRLKLKIFLREDIFDRITEEEFREATHITKYRNLTWTKDALINVVANRIVYNKDICDYFKIEKNEVLGEFKQQRILFERLFDSNSGSDSVVETIMKNLLDGKGRNCPRDMIGLLQHLKNLQITRIEIGADIGGGRGLFDSEILESAFDLVSSEKLHKVLYAEYSEQKKFVKILDGMKNGFSYNQLKALWGVDDLGASDIIDSLMSNGFFNKNNRFKTDTIYVSPIYSRSLSLA